MSAHCAALVFCKLTLNQLEDDADDADADDDADDDDDDNDE